MLFCFHAFTTITVRLGSNDHVSQLRSLLRQVHFLHRVIGLYKVSHIFLPLLNNWGLFSSPIQTVNQSLFSWPKGAAS